MDRQRLRKRMTYRAADGAKSRAAADFKSLGVTHKGENQSHGVIICLQLTGLGPSFFVGSMTYPQCRKMQITTRICTLEMGQVDYVTTGA